MKDLKIKVNTPEESKEAQDLFFKLGCYWGESGKNYVDLSTYPCDIKKWGNSQISYCHAEHHYIDCKEITLQELRTLAKKEYLDENFNLVYGSGVYEVPEGATFASGDDFGNMVFRKDGFYFEKGEWKKTETTLDNSVSLGLNIVWQRSNKCADTPQENDHYYINVSDVDEIDFYEIALRYNVTDPCIQHILKKCLAVGNRGHKDFHTDLKDIAKTANRMLVIHGVN